MDIDSFHSSIVSKQPATLVPAIPTHFSPSRNAKTLQNWNEHYFYKMRVQIDIGFQKKMIFLKKNLV